jgi:hypothetical protein
MGSNNRAVLQREPISAAIVPKMKRSETWASLIVRNEMQLTAQRTVMLVSRGRRIDRHQ